MNEAQISKQHPIPQNFMDVEFKIVGDFTVRQFTYLCATGLPMYLVYNSPLQSFLKTIILIILGLFGFLLVFVPIDDRSMDVWIVNFFKSVYSNNRRVWRKTPVIPKTLSMEAIKLVQGEMITLAPTSSRRKLEEYLKGIKEEAPDEYDFNFKKFQFNEIYSPAQVSITPEVEVLTQEPMIIPAERIQETITPASPVIEPSVIKVVEKAPEPIAEKTAVEEVVLKIPQTLEKKPEEPVIKKPLEFAKKIIQTAPSTMSQVKEMIKPKPVVTEQVDVHEEFRTSSVGVPGRKFVSFSKKEQEIILPIRGERRINIPTTTQAEPIVSGSKDIKTLTKELRTLVREIKYEENKTNLPPVPNEIVIENNLTGLCFDEKNNPLANLLIALLDENNNELQYSRTDNLGKFTFKNTQTGNFKVKILNPEVYSLNFDIINISVTRYPYTIIQIIGKK